MEDNFIITDTGQIYVIDFDDATFLPTSFMSFVLYGGKKPLARRISDKVSIPRSANHGAMSHASYVLNISSTSQLGKRSSAAVYIREMLTGAFLFLGL